MLAGNFSRASELMTEDREDEHAHSCGEDFVYLHYPPQHWNSIWKSNLLERVNEEIKRRTRVFGIIPNDAAIGRLVGAVLVEQAGPLHANRSFSSTSPSATPTSRLPSNAAAASDFA